MNTSIGLQRGIVKLMPYTDEWKQLFNKEVKNLKSWLGNKIIDIKHIGSTSIPNINAKPVIDMLLGVKSLSNIEDTSIILKRHGYIYRENGSSENQKLFVKGPEEKRTHYLHIREYNSDGWKRDLLFKDYLLKHRNIADEYNSLKKDLASRYPKQRIKYTEGKSRFIQSVIKKAESEN